MEKSSGNTVNEIFYWVNIFHNLPSPFSLSKYVFLAKIIDSNIHSNNKKYPKKILIYMNISF